ncbi:unnamed protein product [Rangifer tarandus platyrhynchus]|uniref:Uncharacterized protein n=1 Tax=Rangifer tarandus platyrhynchus TaxID=3082113 RepID=A0AC59YA32_RANTA
MQTGVIPGYQHWGRKSANRRRASQGFSHQNPNPLQRGMMGALEDSLGRKGSRRSSGDVAGSSIRASRGLLPIAQTGSIAVKIPTIMASPQGIPQPCRLQVRLKTPGDPKLRRLAGEARPLTHLTKGRKRASPQIPAPANPSRREEPVKRITGNDVRRTCFVSGWRQAFETRGHGLAPAQPLPPA